MLKQLFLIFLFACSSVWANSASTIKIISPYPPGGPSDTSARLIQQALSKELKVTVIVENKPGANTVIGTIAALNSKEPVLLLAAPAVVINTFQNPQPYSEKQLMPVVHTGTFPLVLVASNKSKIDNFQKFKNNKQRPIMAGNAGTGSVGHLAMEKLNSILKHNITYVPYKGTAPLVFDIIAGHIDIGFVALTPSLVAHIQNKDLVALAIDNGNRIPSIKDVPTFREFGINIDLGIWAALFENGRWDKQQLKQIQTAIKKIMTDPNLSASFKESGLIWTPEEIIPPPDFIDRQRQLWAPLFKFVP